MKTSRKLLFTLAAIMGLPFAASLAQAADPQIKDLVPPKDPTKETVLIGRPVSDGLAFELALEGAEAMWMQMGTPVRWGEHVPAKLERYRIELKATDNATKTRLPYSAVTFAATNRDNGKSLKVVLPPMWGSSGLHHSENSALVGDGVYAATVTANLFMR